MFGSHCTNCVGDLKMCVECDSGHFINFLAFVGENGCYKCPIGCSECEDFFFCTKCDNTTKIYDEVHGCVCLPGYIQRNTLGFRCDFIEPGTDKDEYCLPSDLYATLPNNSSICYTCYSKNCEGVCLY